MVDDSTLNDPSLPIDPDFVDDEGSVGGDLGEEDLLADEEGLDLDGTPDDWN